MTISHSIQDNYQINSTDLYRAILNNQLPRVCDLLNQYPSFVDEFLFEDQFVNTLNLAIEENNFELAKILIDLGADITRIDRKGNTALHIASQENIFEANQKNLDDAKNERLKIFDLIISFAKQQGIDDYVLRVNNLNKTALHCAIEMGYREIVQKLLDYGADLDFEDLDGKNSLHLAMENDDLEMVKILIKNKKIQIEKKFIALQVEREEISSIDRKEYLSLELQKYLEKKIEVIGEFFGARPIHFAVLSDNYDLVKLLLDYKVDVDVVMFNNFSTPLHIATENDNFDIVKILLEANCVRVFFNKEGEDAFFIAVKKNHHQLIKLLFDFGIEFNQTIQLIQDRSAIISKETYDIIAYLLKYQKVRDVFSKAYKQLKPDLKIKVNAQDSLNFPTFSLVERFIFENPNRDQSFCEVIAMSNEVINFIAQKPQALEFFDKISTNFLQQCVNQAIAGFTCIATYVAMSNQTDIKEQLEVAKRLQVMENINLEILKKLSELPQDQIPKDLPLNKTEIILGNEVLKIIHKKWLENNAKSKIGHYKQVFDLHGSKSSFIATKTNCEPWLGVSLLTHEEGHSHRNLFEGFIDKITQEIGSKESLINKIDEVLTTPIDQKFVEELFLGELGHNHFTAEFLTLIVVDDETRIKLQKDQQQIRSMIDNCDTTQPDYYEQLQSLSKQLHQAQQDYSDKIKSTAKEIILDQLIPKKRSLDIDSLLNPSSPSPHVSNSESLLQRAKLQRI